MLVGALLKSSRERSARDVLDAIATHASLVYDVTDTGHWAQNGSTHCRVFVTCKL